MLTVDLPGTPAEALDVAVADRVLTIAVATDELSWSRSVRLGAALDAEQVSARYADGRLTVTVAAAATAEPRRWRSPPSRLPPAIDVSTDVQPENGTSDNG